MTISELIKKLEAIKDQNKKVYISGEYALREFTWHEHVHDHPHATVIG